MALLILNITRVPAEVGRGAVGEREGQEWGADPLTLLPAPPQGSGPRLRPRHAAAALFSLIFPTVRLAPSRKGTLIHISCVSVKFPPPKDDGL